MPTFPAFDLSSFDLRKLDLSSLNIDIPGVDRDKVVNALRDAAYVTIGFGVLAFQQAQVRRRELVKSLSTRFGIETTKSEQLLAAVEAQVKQLDARFEALEAKLDAAVDKIEERLPEQAGALLGQAHGLAKAARKQVRGLLVSAA
jgi:hypothetical protein